MKNTSILSIFIFFLLLVGFCFSGFQSIAQDKHPSYLEAKKSFENKKYSQALKEVTIALESDLKQYDYWYLKTQILTEMGEALAALDIFNKMVDSFSNDPRVYFDRGNFLTSIRMAETAVKDFEKGLSLNTADSMIIPFYLNSGSARIYYRDFKGAYADFRQAYNKDSSNVSVLNNLGMVAQEIGKEDEAIFYMNKIIQLDPKFLGGYVNLGYLYQLKGDFKQSVSYLDKALLLDPNEALALNNRGYSKLKLGDLKGALADVKKSIKLYPANAYAYRNLGLIHLSQEKNDEACKDFYQALDMEFTKQYGNEVINLIKENCRNFRR